MRKIGKFSATIALLTVFTMILATFAIRSDAAGLGNALSATFTYNVGSYSSYHWIATLINNGIDAGSVEIYNDNSYLYIRAVVWSKPWLAYGEIDHNGDGILDDPTKNRDDLGSDGTTITIGSMQYKWYVGVGKERNPVITVPSWNNDIGPAKPNILSGPIVYLAKIPLSGSPSSLQITVFVHASPPGPGIDCPFPCTLDGVSYYGKDSATKGNWHNPIGSPLGVYGSYAHILPNPPTLGPEIPVDHFEIPVGQWTYADFGWTSTQIAGLPLNKTEPPYWDEYVTLNPPILYYLNGTLYNMPGIGPIHYPVFEWTWEDNFNSADPRAALFEVCGGGGRRLTVWDDGGERGFPSDGYFNVTLTFPEGCFMLSLYGYDMERNQRDNQMIYITNQAGNVLASGMMQGQDFNEGIYLQFVVHGPITIVAQVKKSPGSINALLSGIFVDLLPPCEPLLPQCGVCKGGVTELTLGYVGTNAALVQVYEGTTASLSKKLFEGTIQPSETFTFKGIRSDGTMGTEISIYVNGQKNTQIHTSCSQPIGPGLIKGDFIVAGGKSKDGGPLCPISPACGECNVFGVTSNSTVSQLVFNSTSGQLRFTVTGPSGTTGYVKVVIAKTLIGNINGVKVYLDGSQVDYTAISLEKSWLLYFTYQHSTHEVTIALGAASTPFAETLLGKAIIYGMPLTAIVVVVIAYYLRKHARKKDGNNVLERAHNLSTSARDTLQTC